MVQIEITKQPLYGTVYWNGSDFVYTPLNGYTGSDVYFYIKTENGVSTSEYNYVNVGNLPPIALNPSLTADAFSEIIISINQLVLNDTNPFSSLKIIKVSDPVKGTIENNEDSIRYIPNTLNTIETINYVVSDKQYSTTGVLTLSVLNGRTINPNRGIQTFKYRLIRYYDKLLTVPPLTSNWDSAYYTLSENKDYWLSIDTYRWISFSKYIEKVSSDLILLYDNKSNYDSAYNLISSNSGTWISDKTPIDFVKNNRLKFNYQNYILNLKKDAWDLNSTNYSQLSPVIDEKTPIYNKLAQTVSDNIDNWDSNVIYNVIEDNRNKWDTTFEELSTNGKFDKWNNTFLATTSFSSDYNSEFSDIVNFEATFNAITSLSSVWSDQQTETIIVSSDKWTAVSNRNTNYNDVYNVVSGASSKWIVDTVTVDDIHSLVSTNSSTWNGVYDELMGQDPINWTQLSSFNETLSNVNINYNSLYNTITSYSGNWDTTEILSYFENHYNINNGLYDYVTNSIDRWNNNFNAVTSLSSNVLKLDNTYNIISSQSSTWNNLASSYGFIPLYGDNLSSFNDNRATYDSLYSILCSNSSLWYRDTTNINTLSTYLFTSSPIWVTMSNIISASDWDATGNYFKELTGIIGENNILFDSLYNTITSTSGKWTGKIFSSKLSSISSWNKLYDVISIDAWNLTNSLTTVSSNYYASAKYLNPLNSFIDSKLSLWTNQTVNTILTANSGNWYNNYYTVTTYSNEWSFTEKPEYISTYSYVSSNSAKFINLVNLVSAKSGAWQQNISNVSSLSNIFASGSGTVNLSTFDLSIYGDTFITGNLSAYGTKVSIDTTLNTTSGFSINNTDNTSAVVIDKIGRGAIFNVKTPTSTVLYVKSLPPTVGVNLSAISNTIGNVSNISLTVSGNLSASGYIYPISDAVTTYQTQSSRYESIYSYVTGASGKIASFITDHKPKYDTLVNYVNSNQLSSFYDVTVPYYNALLSSFNNYSTKAIPVINLITLSGSKFGIDTAFSANSSKYETAYSYVSSKASSSNYSIGYLFNHNNILSSESVSLVLQDDIHIKSWIMVSDVNTTATIDVLSCGYLDFAKYGYPVSITNGNYPTITLFNKNSASNLDSTWTTTYLQKGSVLQFKITNNTDALRLLINLTVEKR